MSVVRGRRAIDKTRMMKPIRQAGITIGAFAMATSLACGRDAGAPIPKQGVVFVCEHGGAKSVVAAALFNARASARNLPFRAESRGVVPDPRLAPAAVAGLRADGLSPDREVPLRVGRADVDGAKVVVAIDPLPPELAKGARVEAWDAIPPMSVDYAASRDAMLPRIDALLDELARERGQPSKRHPE
jgi:arsenate reductase (thioredoxin)